MYFLLVLALRFLRTQGKLNYLRILKVATVGRFLGIIGSQRRYREILPAFADDLENFARLLRTIEVGTHLDLLRTGFGCFALIGKRPNGERSARSDHGFRLFRELAIC